MPITSPVLFISGPRIASTPGSFWNGNTGAFTATWEIAASPWRPSCLRVFPSITFVATFASGTPIAFETYGTVRLARGFASSTYTAPSFTASWRFTRPRTPRARQIRRGILRVDSRTFGGGGWGGGGGRAGP